MNYRETTSRLSGLTKINVSLVLIATCVLAVLLVMGVHPSNPAHAQQNEGDQSQAGAQNPTTPLVTPTPIPYFSVTWTATADGQRNTVDGTGAGIVETRHVVMAGSSIVRKLDNRPDGAEDAFPFNVTITDDYDKVRNVVVQEVGCLQGGLHRDH